MKIYSLSFFLNFSFMLQLTLLFEISNDKIYKYNNKFFFFSIYALIQINSMTNGLNFNCLINKILFFPSFTNEALCIGPNGRDTTTATNRS